jgi:hypothetical protein
MESNGKLDCLKCASFCCRMAGYVSVSRADIRRLAKHLGLTVSAFEAKHIVEKTRKGDKRIKSGFDTCQFLNSNHRCSVYEARPKDCRGYVCWDQEDDTVFRFAQLMQMPMRALRRQEAEERDKGER